MARPVTPIGWRILPDDSGCWNWDKPYGSVWSGGKSCYVHRVVYEALVGPVPEGLELDHLCRNPRCVNPDHLEPVTHLVNVQRGTAGEWQVEKTHCPVGHPYSGPNLYISYNGGYTRRHCRTCKADVKRRTP